MIRSLFAFALLALVAIAKDASSEEGSKSEGQPSAKASPDYILQASDLLHIQVFQEEDLTREVRISQEYTITLPLIGKIDVKGLSLRQMEEKIRKLYEKDFLVNPQVTIVVKEYAKLTVDVQGQVGKPGSVEFPQERGLTLLSAITRAGGFTRLSDRSQVLLTRKSADGSSETFKINANDIIEGKNKESWPLQVDDIIYVKERIL